MTERLIKKYKNRRLYDTHISRYITIDDLRQYILDDQAFRVIEVETNQDISNTILLQILVESEGGTSRFLSADLLKQFIKMAHNPTTAVWRENFQKFLSQWQGFFDK